MNSFNSNLKSRVKSQSCCLCVGLDMSPEALKDGGLTSLKDHTFNVIDATRDYAVAYKPNFAFFERWGAAGFAWLEETVAYIGDDYIKIADAKRGDIGNTAKQYAESIFSHFGFDCVTLSPYMGRDSIAPFLEQSDKGVFILCRTSNPSSTDLQGRLLDGEPLYERVAHLANDLNTNDNVGLVVGATAPEELTRIRKISPELSLLIPGVGAQGGDLDHSVKVGNHTGAALINVSRGISFTGDMTASAIHNAAKNYSEKMDQLLK